MYVGVCLRRRSGALMRRPVAPDDSREVRGSSESLSDRDITADAIDPNSFQRHGCPRNAALGQELKANLPHRRSSGEQHEC
jgi:hypothetical protein